MKNAIVVSIMAMVLAVGAASVYAGPPMAGTYKSTLGQFDEGREASSWAAGGYLGNGNVLFAQSYAGGVATTDWLIGCPYVVSVSLIVDLTFGGNGQKIYQITYAGGYMTLGGPGTPWDGGDPSYTGNIDTFTEIRTIQYAGGIIVGAVSDYAVSAHLQNYSSSCMTWAIGNGVLLGSTPALSGVLQSVKPAGYPDWHDANCNVAGNTGHWGDVRDLTLSITGCAVSTQQSTWGNVKSLYRD